MAKDRSAEVKAGIVVLVGIAILLGGLFWVSGGADQFADKALYTIHFENGGGIGNGDNVYLAGQRRGSVDSVNTAEAERDGIRRPFVAVRVQVDKDARIYEDSVFRIEKTITNVVTLHIEYGAESKVLATSKSKLFGERLSTFEETIDTAQGLLISAQEGMQEFRALIADVRGQVGHIALDRIQAQAEEILAKVDRAAAHAEGLLADARPPVNETLAKANRAAGHVEELTGAVKTDWRDSLEPKVETLLDRAGSAAGEADAILKENRERFKSILQQADDVMRRVAPVMETIENLGRDLDETVVELRPGLVRTIDRAKKAMENFAATTEDLKTAPWKLVNKPSDKESDIVHLYNSSRLYVEAASQIQDNIQDLETLRRLGVLEDGEKADLVQRATARLEEALEDFESRQKRFYEAIVAFSGK